MIRLLTPGMANVLAAIKDLSAKKRYGKRVPADLVDATYYARAIQGLVDRGLLIHKWNPTFEDHWYEVVDLQDKATKLATIRIEDPKGHTLHVFSTDVRDQVLADVQKALRAGHVVRWEDGSREWWELRERVNLAKSGSDQYEWDRAGNKVRADVVRKVQNPKTKGITEAIVGSRFVRLG